MQFKKKVLHDLVKDVIGEIEKYPKNQRFSLLCNHAMEKI